jgi:hypothetical protein
MSRRVVFSCKRTVKRAVFVSLGIWPTPETRKATEVRAWQNLIALRNLGYEITVVTNPDVHGRALNDCQLVLTDAPPKLGLLEFFRDGQYRRAAQKIITNTLTEPTTLLFCEHWMALASSPRHGRVVYSCHDFEAKILRLRRSRRRDAPTWKTRLHWQVANRLERRLHSKVTRFISVSATEADQLRKRYRVPVEYIPIVSPLQLPREEHFLTNENPRIWFYGNAAATANKIMLDHLKTELFDLLKTAVPTAEFHQAGSYIAYESDKIDWLKKNFQAHGFVEHPESVFRPGDICLIPYLEDTGFRTKIPELLGYGVIPIGYPISFASCPELRHNVNCIIASTPHELAQSVGELYRNSEYRTRLISGATNTIQNELSSKALFPKYQRVLEF